MRSFLLVAFLSLPLTSNTQPVSAGKGVRFSYAGEEGESVFLAGDFNGWSRTDDPLIRDSAGIWRAEKILGPGRYEYKFILDGERYVLDPGNPATVGNFDGSSENSVFVLTKEGMIRLTGETTAESNPGDRYPIPDASHPLYLNIIWHQHQPLYVDPVRDQLLGPWVRTHATKDYYDMAAILREYPDIHVTVNLTSSLLLQLQEFYVDRMAPYADIPGGTFDAARFLAERKGKTDPWIDLALVPTSEFGSDEKDLIYRNSWNAFGISEVMVARFPEYAALKARIDVDQLPGYDLLSVEQMREAKFWFFLAHFDPDFLRGPVRLEDGSVCDLSDLVEEVEQNQFQLRREVTEADCRRLVLEAYKVMKNVVPLHRSLLYDPASRTGQIDVITTPYYHPILPLIYDSDLARVCQPNDDHPARFSRPADAEAHVSKAVQFYEKMFGRKPLGLWPAEGAVAQAVLPLLRRHGIEWVASDVKVLRKSDPEGQPNNSAYRFPAGSDGNEEWIAAVFRDTELSDKIGFQYQTYEPEAAAEDFVRSILAKRDEAGGAEFLLTVILDGENAWEWYREDMDAKLFLRALYRKLTKLQELGLIRTTTMAEYLRGNPGRGIPEHPLAELPAMRSLWPGSWINANFDTWIGEQEENRGWELLRETREDLDRYGPPQPDPARAQPSPGTNDWYDWMAWESMYAAEGSDWFWWYGRDQLAPGGDEPFDNAFRVHLGNVYRFLRAAGREVPLREFPPVLGDHSGAGGQGVMAQSRRTIPIVFTCDMTDQVVDNAVFIVGNLIQLGAWTPGRIRMFDDGTHGDKTAGDGIWSLAVDIPLEEEIEYKYTKDGKPGEWGTGDELPGRNRVLRVSEGTGERTVVSDRFGRLANE